MGQLPAIGEGEQRRMRRRQGIISGRRKASVVRGVGRLMLAAGATCLMVALSLSLVAPSVHGQSAKDVETKPLPILELPVPESETERSYLGLGGTGTFSLEQIKAPLLLIEVFSFYCPHCHNLAPRVNEVYQAIEARPDLKGRIKMIGIGIGNSAYEVKLFKEKFKALFPCFPDQDMKKSFLLWIPGTPTFIGAKRDEKGSFQRVFFKPGTFPDATQFLADFLKAAGLE